MPTLLQVRDRVNNWLEQRWPIVVARQETYFSNNGTYWQGLLTHNAPPEHTTDADGDTAPDNLDGKPTDVSLAWRQFFSELDGVPMPAQLRMDVYSGPLGPGFVATVTIGYNSTLYRRIQQFGPESWRNVSWHEVEEF